MRRVYWVPMLALLPGCKSCVASKPAAPEAPALSIPHKTGPLRLDGELGEADWRNAGRTGAFPEPGKKDPARPYSDGRLLWDEERLYLGLYAADENIVTASGAPNMFHVRIARGDTVYGFSVSPRGKVTSEAPSAAWTSNATVGMDLDGTLDDPKDDDEEWVVEMGVPWKALGVEPGPGVRLRLELGRCDTPKDGQRRCGQWGSLNPASSVGGIVLAP